MGILDKSFQHMNVLEKSLNASWLRNEVIANNMANVNTPNFKRSTVKFESILKDAWSNDTVEGKRTHQKHLPVGNVGMDRIEPMVGKDTTSKYRKDGNNVNIDVEMANLAKNTMNFYLIRQRISDKLRTLKIVVKDGR
ncbi:flagellar basal body rod protein FlgB [Clostridiaceae bacterium 35-E11]